MYQKVRRCVPCMYDALDSLDVAQAVIRRIKRQFSGRKQKVSSLAQDRSNPTESGQMSTSSETHFAESAWESTTSDDMGSTLLSSLALEEFPSSITMILTFI
jgi:hypothetical protein